jgi:2-amino-4-hydroxy-6-hydroxymethyldihydropteridine diphosphokinase
LKIVYLALGSNLGNRSGNLQDALKKLQRRDLRLRRASSLYETEPMSFANQPWFLNQVVEFETELHPRQLLERVHRIEHQLGRKRTIPNGPRTIDIDIVLFEDGEMKTPELEIPHPRYRERRFVLEPLAEINPALKNISELLASVSNQQVRRFRPDRQ